MIGMLVDDLHLGAPEKSPLAANRLRIDIGNDVNNENKNLSFNIFLLYLSIFQRPLIISYNKKVDCV